MRQTVARWDADLQQGHAPILRYGFSVICVAFALLLALAMEYYQLRDAELPLFCLAIAAVTWATGIGPSIFAILLSTLVFNYFFTEPIYSFEVSRRDIPFFLVFIAWAIIVAWVAHHQRRIEDSLRQARDRLQIEVEQRAQQARLLDQTHDSIFFRDLDGCISYWNRGAQEMYGWSADQAIGKSSHDLLRTVFPAPLTDINKELLRAGVWEGELKHTKADGTKVITATRWSLRRDDHGQPLIVMETNNDITDRKHREEEVRRLNLELAKRAAELESANKELESFAYSVSHDLRAPLRHITGYAALLQKHASSALDEMSDRYMKTILQSSRRMGILIDDLLAFSRIGRAKTNKAAVDLDPLVREVVAELGEEAKGRDVAWKIGKLPVCYGDRSMLKVVFANLLSNALKFTRMRERAEIEIGCADGMKNEAEIFVSDNGAGFDMRYVNKLFGVFQRLHASEEFEGTGIGLATVQRIVQRHGGTIRAEGVVDQGAAFYFSLPRA